MAKKTNVQGFNLHNRLHNVRVLFTSNRIKEAIAYLYILYTELAKQKFGIAKRYSQTIRDFAIVCVKQFNQNPQTIYPFIQLVENVIYGGYNATPEYFQQIINSFAPLYTEITGQNLPQF